MHQSLLQLNLYRSAVTDETNIRRERLQTRIYISLLFIFVVVLLSYSSLQERAIVETIVAPQNATEYEALRRMYGDALECACSRISLEYETFISKLQVGSFHPVCNSSFVGARWFTYLVPASDLESYIPNEDFRQWMVAFFRLLSSLCSLARDQLRYSLSTFLSSSMVINRLISPTHFEQQVNTTLRQLQQQIPAQFAQTVDLVRVSYQGNALISVFSSNWQYLVQNNNRSDGALLTRRPVSYENGTCSCGFSRRCTMVAMLFNVNQTAFYKLDGVRLGCTILESVLQSSLKCFYSMACIDSLTEALPLGDTLPDPWFMIEPGRFLPMESNQSTFNVNDTMETIISRMFINRWEEEVSYDGYFQGCGPRECTYTSYYRFDPLDIITTFLSIFGGLSTVLRVLVPILLKISDKIHAQRLVRPAEL